MLVGRLRVGPYREKLARGLENAARGRRSRAAFSSPMSHFFPIRTDSKPANNIFILAYKFFTSGFVYGTLPLNRLTRRLQYKPFAKNLTNK